MYFKNNHFKQHTILNTFIGIKAPLKPGHFIPKLIFLLCYFVCACIFILYWHFYSITLCSEIIGSCLADSLKNFLFWHNFRFIGKLKRYMENFCLHSFQVPLLRTNLLHNHGHLSKLRNLHRFDMINILSSEFFMSFFYSSIKARVSRCI